MKKLMFIVMLFLASASLFSQEYNPKDFIVWSTEGDTTIPESFDYFVVHPNGNVLASTSTNTYELDGKTGKLIRAFPIEAGAEDVSSDGNLLVTSSGSWIRILDYKTLKVLKSFPKGRIARFFKDNNRIIFGNPKNITTGWDSSLIVLNLKNDSIKYIQTDYVETAIAFSPDGKYFATGGFSDPQNGDKKTYLTLWDANSYEKIKDLFVSNLSNPVRSIKFSPDSKLVGYQVYFSDLYIFKINDYSLLRAYNSINTQLGVRNFCFVNNEKIFTTASNQTVTDTMNLILKNLISDIEEFHLLGIKGSACMDLNLKNNSLVACSPILYSLDLNKIYLPVKEPVKQDTISIEYNNGILKILNSTFKSPLIEINITNLNGKIIFQNNFESNDIIEIPLKLVNGVYILNIIEGKNNIIQKFIVNN